MKRLSKAVISFVISLVLIVTSAVTAFAWEGPATFVPEDESFGMDSDLQTEWYDLVRGEMIVTFEEHINEAEAKEIGSEYGLTIKEPIVSLTLDGPSYIVSFDSDASLVRTTMMLFIDERIKYATPNAPIADYEPKPEEKYTTPIDFSGLTAGEDYADGEVLVTLDSSVPDIPFACRLMEKYGCVVTSINGFSNKWEAGKVVTARIVNSKTVPETLNEIQMDPFVAAASPNMV